jgi:hypothetical protein
VPVRRGRWWRWSLVAAAVAVLVSLPAVIAAWPVHAAEVPPAQLADRIAASAVTPYQGFVLSSGIAGLPNLPQVSDVIALLNGETHLRAYYAGPQRWRVDQIGPGTERDLYQTASGQVLWDFGANRVTSIVGELPVRLPRGADLVPPDLARRLVAIARASVPPPVITRLPDRRVAGHAAAGIRIAPADPAATVDHIDIWADPATGLGEHVAITGRGASVPVLETRFLDLSFGTPGDATLTPPTPTADVEGSVSSAGDVNTALNSLRPGPLPSALAGKPRVAGGTGAPSSGSTFLLFGNNGTVLPGSGVTFVPVFGDPGVGGYGSGFTEFLVLSVNRDTGRDATDRATKAGGLPVSFTGGQGVLLSTSLFSVMVVSAPQARRTYLLVGLVDPDFLVQAGRELAAFRGQA